MNQLRSELKKITSTRLWWGLLLGALLWTAFNAGLSAAFAGQSAGPGQPATPGLDDPAMIRQVYANAAFAGPYVFALILGIAGMTGEHRYQTITPTLLATPKRSRVVLAKLAAHAMVGMVFGVAGALVAFGVGGAVVAARGFDLGLATDGLWPAVLGAVLAVGVWTLIGVGLGTLIRNQVAAILVAVLITFLVEPLLTFAATAVDQIATAMKFSPTNASSAMTSPPDTFLNYLEPWQGGLVMLGYAVLFTAVGLALTARRDVT